jgi:hypothetical protein
LTYTDCAPTALRTRPRLLPMRAWYPGIIIVASTCCSQRVSSEAVRSCGAVTEWRRQDGGNGHWYAPVLFQAALRWPTARSDAQAMGGYLATVTSEAEYRIVQAAARREITSQCIGSSGPFLGGYQDRTAPDFSEPGGGWRWVTGETWAWTPSGTLSNSGLYGEDFLHLLCNDLIMNDISDLYTITGSIIEWDSMVDCNINQLADSCEIAMGTPVLCVSFSDLLYCYCIDQMCVW